ncbi:pre-rRNA processing protein [Malassezia equina]|uniref:Pre-rRNA processing protein n=1 Tax=Malassezia equina TaxID=1381935 RepID=A0AAF0IYF4_9BASI|nr:pre-rRNA processing protein [Malassezia equina]
MAEAGRVAERRVGLEQALARIRHHTTSKLQNQRMPAQLLVAIEATLAERAASDATEEVHGPTAYLLALESLLSAESVTPDVHASAVYLLSTVLPHVAAGVVRAKSVALLSAVAAPLAEPHGASENMNARIRAALGVVEALLEHVPPSDRVMLERERTWTTVWDLVLSLCIDARPKVRRRAHELVAHVLGLPAWEHRHPYAMRTMRWAVQTLEHVAAARGVATTKTRIDYDKKSGQAKNAKRAALERQQNAAEGAASTGIWVCALLHMLVPLVPVDATAPLVPALLALPALSNPFLTLAVYDVFAALFRAPVQKSGLDAPADALPPRDATLVRQTIQALRAPAHVPAHTDIQTLPAYLRVLESCMVAYSAADAAEAWAATPALWADVLHLGLSAHSDAARASADVRLAARSLLQALARYSVSDEAVAHALTDASAPLCTMIESLRDALGAHALTYTHARADILQVLASLVTRLRVPLEAGAVPPAVPLLLDTVEQVAALRTQKHFDARGDADAVLGAAIAACGPRAILARLPLQLLEGGRPATQGRGRAWLLPLLRAHCTNTELSHFVEEFVPLSEALFELRVQAEQPSDGSAPRPVEAKVMEALIEQVWACFPGYCDLARDVDQALTPAVLELLVQVLRTQRALRPAILQGLALLVQRTESLMTSHAPSAQLRREVGADQADGQRFLAHLRQMAGPLLSALFQLLSELPSQARGPVMECMGVYLAILDAPSVAATFGKVRAMLEQALQTYVPSAPAPGQPEANSPRYVPPVPHTMLDLCVALVPYVHGAEARALFDVASHVLPQADGGLQKKAYRVLSRLLRGNEAPALRAHYGVAALLQAWMALDVQPGAVRDRLQLLTAVVPHVPSTELGVLGALVPEAVLGTKEANQGAREAAYELLVQMGHRLQAGGLIDRAMVGSEGTVEASANEFVMMVVAGLAGASPHMMGATIAALARLLYEFAAVLPEETISELLATMLVFLESTNREILKGALGFCKVALVTLPPASIEASLPTLVPALLQVQHVHKNHFKGRVRHMLERLLRRYGEPAVRAHVGEEHQRLITHIRKRKERAKRRRAQDEQAEATGAVQPRDIGTDAFEEALYGSASESEEESEEEPVARGGRRGARAPARQRHREDDAYLIEDDDMPMDLLGDKAVTAVRPRARAARRQPGQEAQTFETDESGRLRIPNEAAEKEAGLVNEVDAQAGQAYLAKSQGVDGFTFGRGGAVKFNKNTKRTRANEREDDDNDEASAPSDARRRPKRTKQAIGAEFKARRAQGDVQKGGVSPYAYVPLSSVTGKKKAKQASKLAITGKRM